MEPGNQEMVPILVYALGEERYGLPLSAVDRVVLAAAVTPVLNAPETVLGVINIHGQPLAVVSMRRKLGLPGGPITPSNRFIVMRTQRHVVALLVDDVADVLELPASSLIPPRDVHPGLASVMGMVKLPDGLVLIYDPDRFLALDEEAFLAESAPPAGTG
jgi:purine-binding chemotaxis protein CheW